jgi:hypothetical protein
MNDDVKRAIDTIRAAFTRETGRDSDQLTDRDILRMVESLPFAQIMAVQINKDDEVVNWLNTCLCVLIDRAGGMITIEADEVERMIARHPEGSHVRDDAPVDISRVDLVIHEPHDPVQRRGNPYANPN